MQVTVSARHEVVLDEPLRERAHTMLNGLGRFGAGFMEATAVFDHAAGNHRVEVRLHRAVGATPIIATAEGVDFRSALDAVEGKLRRQLERSRRHTSQRRHVSA